MTLMLLGCILIVTSGLWCMISPPVSANDTPAFRIFLMVAGIVSILVFGILAILYIRKLLDKRPGLSVDEFGIVDNSSAVAAGLILWSDIEQLSVMTIRRQQLIMIKVKNPQHYINRQTGGFKKKMMSLNYKMYGTPLSISAGGLKISADALWTLLNDYHLSKRV